MYDWPKEIKNTNNWPKEIKNTIDWKKKKCNWLSNGNNG